MALRAAVVLAALLLENHDLRAAGLLDDLADNSGAVHQRLAGCCLFAFADEQHLVESDLVARFSFQLFDNQNVVLRDLVLLAACLDDSVHLSRLRMV